MRGVIRPQYLHGTSSLLGLPEGGLLGGPEGDLLGLPVGGLLGGPIRKTQSCYNKRA